MTINLAPSRSRRFIREAQATSLLTSPHTVALYDFGRTRDGILYYVMELLTGINLEDLVRRFGPLPAARAAHIIRQVSCSLEDAHRHGLVHRDIKPANIQLCRRGRDCDFVKVLDFGLVKRLTPTGPEELGLTTPDILYWPFSGEIVFMTVLGGFRTFTGPIVGAFIEGAAGFGTPVAISAMLRIEQGATIMPIVGNEPEEIGAARSPIACATVAQARRSAGLSAVSNASVTSAERLITR
jgi:serine/threonine protein kinase